MTDYNEYLTLKIQRIQPMLILKTMACRMGGLANLMRVRYLRVPNLGLPAGIYHPMSLCSVRTTLVNALWSSSSASFTENIWYAIFHNCISRAYPAQLQIWLRVDVVVDYLGLRGSARPHVTVQFVNRFATSNTEAVRIGLVIERELQEGLRREIRAALRSIVENRYSE